MFKNLETVNFSNSLIIYKEKYLEKELLKIIRGHRYRGKKLTLQQKKFCCFISSLKTSFFLMFWRYTSCKRDPSQGMRKIHTHNDFFYVLPTKTTSPLGFYIWIRKKTNVIQYHLLKTVITKIESFLKASQGKENCTTGTFCSCLFQILLSNRTAKE